MSREFKASPTFTKDISGRLVTGICAVFGNIDDIGDRIHPGAFAKTIDESQGRVRVRHLWNHDFGSPPIASIKRLAEVGRDALPAKVLEFAPEASGGLEVGREYYKGNAMSDWVFQAISVGDVDEMSFGFDSVRYDWTTVGEGAQEIRVRELREVRLYDTSDVLWGMNNATSAAGKCNIPLEVLSANLLRLIDDIKAGKAGRRNASSDLAIIRAIHQGTLDLGCDTCAGLKDPDAEDSGKSGNADSVAAGADSLSALRQRLNSLELAAM